jgi:hypothetical protein
VLLHGGVHRLGPGGIRIERSGDDTRPIIFMGAGDGETVLDGEGSDTIFDIRDTGDLSFENLTIRNGGCAFRADGARRLTILGCTITRVTTGITTSSELSSGFYIADNVIAGPDSSWNSRKKPAAVSTGISLYGKGHVIARNRILRFGDCITIAAYGRPPRDISLKCVSIDICDNDISEASDAGIAADYGCHNIRVFRNRIVNAYAALSARAVYGGPVYFIRNEVTNASAFALRLDNWCAGPVVCNNTLVSAGQAFTSYARWQNGFFRNNLFLGISGFAMETGSPSPRTTLDYDGYRMTAPDRFISWYDGVSEQLYPSIDAFHESTGHEGHGVMVDFDIFTGTPPPAEGGKSGPGVFDLSLKPGSPAVDAGVYLPGIDDGFRGAAPDLGCREQGTPAPSYGPRTVVKKVGVY